MINLEVFSHIYASIKSVFFHKKDHFFYGKSFTFIIFGNVFDFCFKDVFWVSRWWKYHSIKLWVFLNSLSESRFWLVLFDNYRCHKRYKGYPFLSWHREYENPVRVKFNGFCKTGTWPGIRISIFPALEKVREIMFGVIIRVLRNTALTNVFMQDNPQDKKIRAMREAFVSEILFILCQVLSALTNIL